MRTGGRAMIRGAGRLHKRMDTRAAFSTPGGDAVRDGRHLMVQDNFIVLAEDDSVERCRWCRLPIEPGDAHGVFGETDEKGMVSVRCAVRVVAEEHDIASESQAPRRRPAGWV